MDRLYCAYEGPFCQYNDFATAEGDSDCDEACEYLKEIEATESAAPSGQAELPGCITHFDEADAGIMADKCLRHLDGAESGLMATKGSIRQAIITAYKLGQQNK